jgi:hypothetical protein
MQLPWIVGRERRYLVTMVLAAVHPVALLGSYEGLLRMYGAMVRSTRKMDGYVVIV